MDEPVLRSRRYQWIAAAGTFQSGPRNCGLDCRWIGAAFAAYAYGESAAVPRPRNRSAFPANSSGWKSSQRPTFGLASVLAGPLTGVNDGPPAIVHARVCPEDRFSPRRISPGLYAGAIFRLNGADGRT